MTYFHGTNADLQLGELLVPGAHLGVSSNHDRSDHVYLTWDGFNSSDVEEAKEYAMKEAYAWARTACMVAEDETGDDDQHAYVYIVEPIGSVEADGSTDEGVGEEAVRCGSARIIGVVDAYDLYDLRPSFGQNYLNL